MAENKTQDAIALLKEDHRTVEKLFKDFESAKGDGRKEALAQLRLFGSPYHRSPWRHQRLPIADPV